MNDIIPWVIPSKTHGNTLKHKSGKWDSVYVQAATEIAKEESDKCGRKIGFAVLNMNLATQRSAYFTEVRRRLNHRVIELTKEKQRHAHQIKPQQLDQAFWRD